MIYDYVYEDHEEGKYDDYLLHEPSYKIGTILRSDVFKKTAIITEVIWHDGMKEYHYKVVIDFVESDRYDRFSLNNTWSDYEFNEDNFYILYEPKSK
jgi:hypothetical protein